MRFEAAGDSFPEPNLILAVLVGAKIPRKIKRLPLVSAQALIFLRKKQTSNEKEATVGKSRKDASLFQFIDREMFNKLAIRHQIDKGVRSLSTWEMTGALIEALTLRLGSLREAEGTLGVARSTLSNAMASRPSGFFQDLCDQVLFGIRKRTRCRKVKRAIRELLAIDSTEIDVHGSLFGRPSWAKKRGDGSAASLKLHVVWNVDQEWVEDFSISGARKHDSPAATRLRLQPDKMYVFDRAYNDLGWWLSIIQAESHFVTRLKDCAKNTALRKKVLAKARGGDGVLHDGLYEPSYVLRLRHRESLEVVRIRHIVYRDPETKKIFDFVTSDLKAPAQDIANIYRRRWAVELLFRWLKGHLDLRRLTVKNANAAEVQSAAAVLVLLLLQLKRILEKYGGTLWELLRSIRTRLNLRGLSGSASREGCRWSSPPMANLAKVRS